MNSNISVPIPTQEFLELVDFLRKKGDPRDPVVAIRDAIDYWISNADWKPELLAKTDARGYQWKTLFMPAGTQIRMQYKGQYFYAKVEGDSIIFNGEPISPSTLATTVAGGSRNAWRDLWIKEPQAKDWILADDLRGMADKNQKKARQFLAQVAEKGDDAGIKVIESSLGREMVESGLEWKEGDAKKHLEWLKATYGQVRP